MLFDRNDLKSIFDCLHSFDRFFPKHHTFLPAQMTRKTYISLVNSKSFSRLYGRRRCVPPSHIHTDRTTIMPPILYPDASAWHSQHSHGPDATIDAIADAIRRAETTLLSTTTPTTTSLPTTTVHSMLTHQRMSTSASSLFSESVPPSSSASFSSPLLPLILVLKRKIRSFIVESRYCVCSSRLHSI